MDAGVGAFVFLSGLSSRLARSGTPWDRAGRAAAFPVTPLVCALLGLGRLVAVRTLGYQVRASPTLRGSEAPAHAFPAAAQEHVTEYGTEWNFFLTLACLQALDSAVTRARLSPRTVVGAALAALSGSWAARSSPCSAPALIRTRCAVYQIMLARGGLAEWILHAPRAGGSLARNREGVLTLTGAPPPRSPLAPPPPAPPSLSPSVRVARTRVRGRLRGRGSGRPAQPVDGPQRGRGPLLRPRRLGPAARRPRSRLVAPLRAGTARAGRRPLPQIGALDARAKARTAPHSCTPLNWREQGNASYVLLSYAYGETLLGTVALLRAAVKANAPEASAVPDLPALEALGPRQLPFFLIVRAAAGPLGSVPSDPYPSPAPRAGQLADRRCEHGHGHGVSGARHRLLRPPRLRGRQRSRGCDGTRSLQLAARVGPSPRR